LETRKTEIGNTYWKHVKQKLETRINRLYVTPVVAVNQMEIITIKRILIDWLTYLCEVKL